MLEPTRRSDAHQVVCRPNSFAGDFQVVVALNRLLDQANQGWIFKA